MTKAVPFAKSIVCGIRPFQPTVEARRRVCPAGQAAKRRKQNRTRNRAGFFDWPIVLTAPAPRPTNMHYALATVAETPGDCVTRPLRPVHVDCNEPLLFSETIPSGIEFNSTASSALEDRAHRISQRNARKPVRSRAGTNPAKEGIEPIPGSTNEPGAAERTLMKTSCIHPRPETPDDVTTSTKRNLGAVKPSGCETARFGPFGFRITARPGHGPKWVSRRSRRAGAASFFRALTHI